MEIAFGLDLSSLTWVEYKQPTKVSFCRHLFFDLAVKSTPWPNEALLDPHIIVESFGSHFHLGHHHHNSLSRPKEWNSRTKRRFYFLYAHIIKEERCVMLEVILANNYEAIDSSLPESICQLKQQGAHCCWHKHSTFLQQLVSVHNMLRFWGKKWVLGPVSFIPPIPIHMSIWRFWILNNHQTMKLNCKHGLERKRQILFTHFVSPINRSLW